MTTMTNANASDLQGPRQPIAAGGIVVGFDMSPASYAAIESASAIAADRKCAVYVVSVLPPMSAYQTDLTVDQPQSQIEDLRIQIRDAAIRDAIGADFERAGWTREVVTGSAARKIAEVAEKRAADLIIVGRTRNGMGDRMAGLETTLQIMRASTIPVMVVTDEMIAMTPAKP